MMNMATKEIISIYFIRQIFGLFHHSRILVITQTFWAYGATMRFLQLHSKTYLYCHTKVRVLFFLRCFRTADFSAQG